MGEGSGDVCKGSSCITWVRKKGMSCQGTEGWICELHHLGLKRGNALPGKGREGWVCELHLLALTWANVLPGEGRVGLWFTLAGSGSGCSRTVRRDTAGHRLPAGWPSALSHAAARGAAARRLPETEEGQGEAAWPQMPPSRSRNQGSPPATGTSSSESVTECPTGRTMGFCTIGILATG